MNTIFFYGYRDASNYKTHHAVVLSGTLTEEEIAEIRGCADEGIYFIAEQVGLPHEFPGEICSDDHCWCYFYDDVDFEQTDLDPEYGSVHDLLNAFRLAKNNWQPEKYNPLY